MIDLTPLINALILVLAAILTYKVLPWIKARTTAQQQETMRMTVKTLVFAAEQLFGSKTGIEKLAYVQEGLRKRGFDIDIDEIEAAVKEMGLYMIETEKETEDHPDVQRAMNDDTPPTSTPDEWPHPLPEESTATAPADEAPEEPQSENE